jgi:uncharacterized repeat protein (TIGR03803 family)
VAGGGTVFKITAAGTLTTLHSFDCSTEGCHPFAGLIQAGDGNFYGTTFEGGGGGGTIFTIAAAGTHTLTTLHSFDCGTEACQPIAGLIQASDGNFYGTTASIGARGGGSVFKITAAGTLTTLHSFDCSTGVCIPFASLIQASDGGEIFTALPQGESFASSVASAGWARPQSGSVSRTATTWA